MRFSNICTKIDNRVSIVMSISNTKSRGTILFDESIRSKYTKKNYDSHIKEFKRFAKISIIDELLFMPQEKLQELLEDYLIHLKHTTSPNSIPSKFQGIRHFCVMNRITINWEIIRKMIPQRQKTQSLRSYTTKEVKDLLFHAKDSRDKSLIHFLASTGARIGVFDHALSVKHIRKMPYGCSAVLLYAGEVEEYWSFLTPQASKILHAYHDSRKRYGETFSENTPVFTTKSAVPRQLGWNGARSAIYRAISKSGITRSKKGYRYDVQAGHGFRKRFNTLLKLSNSVNYNIAEKLMGHRNGLDGVYFTPTLEDLFTEFRKIMHVIEI